MDVRTSRKFAADLEEDTFDTPQRNALLEDIRAGVYAPDRLSAPFVSLRIALSALNPPASVLERVREMEQAVAPSVVTDDLLRAARAAIATSEPWTFEPPQLTVELLASAESSTHNLLIPNGRFIDAREQACNAETARHALSPQ